MDKYRVLSVVLSAVYFVAVLAIGYLAGKKTKNMSDFMIGGQSLGVWVTSFGIMAAVMSGWTWIGNPAASYSYGYASIVRLFSLGPIGIALSYIILAKPVRLISERFNCMTLPDILAVRWNNNATIRLISAVIILIGCFTYLVSQWSAMGEALQPVLGVSYEAAVIIGALIICAYVVAGGMLASMWTNLLQMIIMFVVSAVLLVKGISSVGGFTEMNIAAAAIDPMSVQPFWPEVSYSMTAVLSFGVLIVGIAYGGQPSVNTKFMMISDHKKLRWAPLISCIALIIGTTQHFIGVAAKVMVEKGLLAAPERPDGILMAVISTFQNPTFTALIMVAVMAAVMSTAESYLFSAASTVTYDFVTKVLRKEMSDKKKLTYTRILIAVVTVVTVFMAINQSQMVVNIAAQAFGCFCAGFAPPAYLGLRWKRINSKGAIAGMLVGLLFGGILPLLGVSPADVGGWNLAGLGFVIAVFVTIIVSLCTKPEHSAVFD